MTLLGTPHARATNQNTREQPTDTYILLMCETQWAGKCSCYKCLPEKDLFDVEYWELEQAKVRKGPASKDFDGKVVAVR